MGFTKLTTEQAAAIRRSYAAMLEASKQRRRQFNIDRARAEVAAFLSRAKGQA